MRRFLVAFALTAALSGSSRAQHAELVPSTSFAVLSIKAGELWDAPSMKPVRVAMFQGEKPIGKPVVDAVGIAPEELERVTLFWPARPFEERGSVPFILVTTRKAFNEAKLLKALKAANSPAELMRNRDRAFGPGATIQQHDAKEASPPKGEPIPPPPPVIKKEDFEPVVLRQPVPALKAEVGPADLYYLDGGAFQALFLLDERTMLFIPGDSYSSAIQTGTLSLIGQLLRKKADGPLVEALKLSDANTIVAGVRVDQIASLLDSNRGNMPKEITPFLTLARASTLLLTGNVGETTKIGVKFQFSDAALARRAEPVLKTLLLTAMDELTRMKKEAGKQGEFAPVLDPLFELAIAALSKGTVQTEGTAVEAKVQADVGPAVGKAMAQAPVLLNAAAERAKSTNNLKQIGLAIHNYHDVNGQMPTDVLDPVTKKPILSWRVQILPYIEQDNLYRQIAMTKSWDDPANKKFLEQAPDIFRVYGRETKDKGMTYYQMPSSDKPIPGGSPFKVSGQRLSFAQITDGLSNTFMVVEAGEPVNWMKPDDVQFDPKNLPKLGDPNRDKFLVLFGDGSVRELRRSKLMDHTLIALLTRDGGEVNHLDEK